MKPPARLRRRLRVAGGLILLLPVVAVAQDLPRRTYGPVTTASAPTITSFSIRDGLPYVTPGRSVPLVARVSGAADVYRMAAYRYGCARDLASAGWNSWNAAGPPTWSSTSVRRHRLCFQLGLRFGRSVLESAPAEDEIEVVRPFLVTGWAGSGVGAKGIAPTSIEQLADDHPFIVAVAVRSGSLIDAAGGRSARLGPNGEHTALSSASLVGGSGGTARTLSCSNGEALTAVRGRSGSVIDSFDVGCRSWRRDRGASGSQRWLGRVGGTGGSTAYELSCPTPLAAVVIQFAEASFAFGLYVDGVRLVCVAPEGL